MNLLQRRSLQTIEQALPYSQTAGPIGVARAADAAGSPDGMLTREELDAYEPIITTGQQQAVGQLKALLDLPAAEDLQGPSFDAPRVETRSVPGEASDWFDLTSVRTSDPGLYQAGEYLREIVMTGAAPVSLEDKIDYKEGFRYNAPPYSFEIQRDMMKWGLRNIEAFYEHEVVPRSVKPQKLHADLERLLEATDAQSDAQSIKVGVLPPEINSYKLPVSKVKIELITEVFLTAKRDGSTGSDSKRYLAVQPTNRYNVVINVTPQARGPGQAGSFEQVIAPEDQDMGRLPMPPSLKRGEASFIWVQVIDKASGDVVENRRFALPKLTVPKINVAPSEIDHWENTDGRTITVS